MALLILASVLLQVALATANSCHGHYQCPQYDVIDKGHGFEVRQYPAYKWAESRVTGVNWYMASHFNFMRLFRYIFGKNQEKVKIPMTVPVVTPLLMDEEGEFKEDFSMMFWLSEKYQCEGCEPTPVRSDHPENDVKIKMVEETTVYSRTFDGYAYETKIKYNAMKLKADLEKAGLVAGQDFDETMPIIACYNSPMHFWARTNEVMYVKK